MELSMILAGGKLLLDIYREISKLVSDAEDEPQLNSEQKHIHVEQGVCRIIDGKKFCLADKDMLKDYVKNEKLIEKEVELAHEKGHFIRG